MLPRGFEPRSSARKAGVIGRATLWERVIPPTGFEPVSAPPEGTMIGRYTTGVSMESRATGPESPNWVLPLLMTLSK